MLEKITLQGFDINQIFNLVGTVLNITANVFGQGTPTSEGNFPSYRADVNNNLVPLSEDEKKQGNQIMLGLAGATGIALVGIWILIKKKKTHAE